ncbi:Zn-ribbon domain-containing OB-fold protein [Rhodoligotrophos defluvii]|uniref:Zn-ribbon domain-containing OB-fold protein n=1 Tax=Rhodoligotrophos defluvii TaxID=2561934 RepID=UPI0014853FCA|nr:OB-fold domain-containing protein [Rhodoligotrophos defluvii]
MNVQTAEETAIQSLAGDAIARGSDGRPVLIGGECGHCGGQMFPRAPVCPACMSEDMRPLELPREGIVYAFTTAHVGPAHWHKPFMVGYVDLPNGVRVFSHLRGEGLRIGDTVQLASGELGRDADGMPIMSFVFQPVERA